MKFCIKCGAKLSDDAQFCTTCGAKCETQSQVAEVFTQEETKLPGTKKPVKKRTVVAIVCAAVLTVLVGVGGFFGIRWYTSPEQQLLRALKGGKYEQALDILEEDISLKYSENLSESLKKRLETIQADYVASTVEYANVMMELDTIESIDIKELRELINKTRMYVEKLNASRTAFATAESFFANAAYMEAVAQYKQVIQEDSNYTTAVAKANEAMGLYRTKMLTDAEVYAASGNYANAITLLQNALNHLPEDALLTQQVLLYEKAQSDQILKAALDDAASYAAVKDYISAMRVLDQYTQKHGANAEVSVAWNTYNEANKALILATALEDAALLASGKDYLAAIAVLDRYTKENGTNTEVSAVRSTYQNAYVDLALADAAVYGDAGAYSNAIAMLNNALKEFPGDSKLTAQVTAYEKAYQAQQLSETLAQAKAYADNKDYLSAMQVLKTYTGDHGTNASVVVALNEYTDKYVNAVLAVAESEYNAEDYVAAITTLRTGLTNVPESSKLSVRLDTYAGAYVADIIAKSDALLDNKEYDDAQQIIDNTIWEILGEEQTNLLIGQSLKIEASRPKNLMEVCEPYKVSSIYYESCINGATLQMGGKIRQNGFITSANNDYVLINLNKRFSVLEFDACWLDTHVAADIQLYVYLDGELYQSYTIESDRLPIHVVIPIENVELLKIVIDADTNWLVMAGFADVILKR